MSSPTSSPSTADLGSAGGSAAGRALADTAAILREVAGHERRVDERRGDVSASVAALIDACGREFGVLPEAVAQRALAVVGAVDRATGNRRRPVPGPAGATPR